MDLSEDEIKLLIECIATRMDVEAYGFDEELHIKLWVIRTRLEEERDYLYENK